MEYPFAFIAAGNFTLVSGSGLRLHLRKNLATGFTQASMQYSFLLEDIFSFQQREKGYVKRCMMSRRGMLARKGHYRPRVQRL